MSLDFLGLPDPRLELRNLLVIQDGDFQLAFRLINLCWIFGSESWVVTSFNTLVLQYRSKDAARFYNVVFCRSLSVPFIPKFHQGINFYTIARHVCPAAHTEIKKTLCFIAACVIIDLLDSLLHYMYVAFKQSATFMILSQKGVKQTLWSAVGSF